MKAILSFLATVLLSCIMLGPAVAQQRSPADTAAPPRGVEGPEIRKETPKGPGGVDTPKPKKKGTRARDQKPRHTDTPPKLNTEPEMTQGGEKKIPVAR
jgi:hypothetical protein